MAAWNKRRVIAERQDDGRYLVMFGNGEVRDFSSAAAVEAELRREDNAAARAGTSTVTEVEWR